MTITATGNRESYAGNGVTTVFAFPHPFFVTTDLTVYEQIASSGATTTLTLGVDYTVSGAGTQTGGSVTRAVATAVGTNIVIVRAVPFTQGASFPNNTAFDGPTVESAFDRSVVLTAQVLDLQGRTPTLPASDIDGSGSYDAKNNKIKNIANAVNAQDAVAKSQLDAAVITGAGYTPSAASISNVPAGNISSVTVQAALNELDTEGVHQADYTTAGDILTRGASSATRKAIGTGGRSLTVDTSQPDKLRWANVNRGIISGLIQAVNAGAATTKTDISAGVAMDATGVDCLELTASLTKQLNATFVVGTGNGGLDTGAVAASTWYYIHLIKRVDTGVVDALYSLSSSAPTMPASYTLARLIGAVHTDAGTLIEAYHAYELAGGGLEINWDTPTLDINLSNTLTTTRRTDTIHVPTAFSTVATVNVQFNDAAAGSINIIYNPDGADVTPASTAAPLFTGQSSTAQSAVLPTRVRTSSTGQVAARSNLATVDNYRLVTLSFEWSRR